MPTSTDENCQPLPAVNLSTYDADARLIGTLVHRLFQRRLDAQLAPDQIAAIVPSLIRPDELADVANRDDVAARATAGFLSLRARDDLRALLADGVCFYEVPFSTQSDPERRLVLRGRIDCVVQHDVGRLTIVEFKTGHPRREHEAQVAVYVEAVRAAVPAAEIRARIFYP